MDRKLGRGFKDLSAERDPLEHEIVSGEVTNLPLDRIVPNPDQPRDEITQEGIEALRASVQTDGVIQPILVRSAGSQFQIVAGERRWRAARLAGLETIPVIIKEVSDKESFELALIENLQREDLNAIQKAKAYKTLMERYGYTQEQVSDRVGQKRPTVANYLRLLELPEDIQQIVSRGTISPGHARAMLTLPSTSAMMGLCQRIISEDLSVRATEQVAAGLNLKSKRTPQSVPPNIRKLQDELAESLGCMVKIRQKAKGGDLVIRFADNEEFDRLFSMLRGIGR